MRLSVDKLKPGMRILHNVANVNGAVIVAAGIEVTAPRIRMLKMWGIHAVEVACGDNVESVEPPPGSDDAEILRKAEAEVNRRLKHVRIDSPAVALVRDFAVQRAAARLGGAPK
jgi:hypothetical protein